MGRDIFFYSISIDPETDTPERLKQYADTFGAGPGWLFLTGKPEDIHAIRHKLGERSRVLSEHRNEVLLGNGATGEWARNNVLGDLDSLALHGARHGPETGVLDAGVQRDRSQGVEFRSLRRSPGRRSYKRLCAGLPHGREGRPGGPRSGWRHRAEGPRLADKLHLQSREDAARSGDPIALAL